MIPHPVPPAIPSGTCLLTKARMRTESQRVVVSSRLVSGVPACTPYEPENPASTDRRAKSLPTARSDEPRYLQIAGFLSNSGPPSSAPRKPASPGGTVFEPFSVLGVRNLWRVALMSVPLRADDRWQDSGRA